MPLQIGDWVETETGEVGKVVQVSRLTVFITVSGPDKKDRLLGLLESDLTKIDPPAKQPSQC